MTRRLESLCLATALAHTVDGAELFLEGGDGRSIVVGRHPSADIGPCDFRRAVIASRCPMATDCSEHVEVRALGGTLRHVGGGVHLDRRDPRGVHWFATTLGPAAAAEALRNAPLGAVPEDRVSATVRPDDPLGVTVIGLAIEDVAAHDAVELAIGALGHCLAIELVQSTSAHVSGGTAERNDS